MPHLAIGEREPRGQIVRIGLNRGDQRRQVVDRRRRLREREGRLCAVDRGILRDRRIEVREPVGRLVELSRRDQRADEAGMDLRMIGRHLGDLAEDADRTFAIAVRQRLFTHRDQRLDLGDGLVGLRFDR